MIFKAFHEIQKFGSQHFEFVRSREDWHILIVVGYAAEQGTPVTFKQLKLDNIVPSSTLQRRLNRLVEKGILQRQQSDHDKRATVYTISSEGMKPFQEYYERFLAASFAQSSPPPFK